ncbi:hypothetical protein ACXR2U_09340 [Jatrophihabitans sp. YIM 134969]
MTDSPDQTTTTRYGQHVEAADGGAPTLATGLDIGGDRPVGREAVPAPARIFYDLRFLAVAAVVCVPALALPTLWWLVVAVAWAVLALVTGSGSSARRALGNLVGALLGVLVSAIVAVVVVGLFVGGIAALGHVGEPGSHLWSAVQKGAVSWALRWGPYIGVTWWLARALRRRAPSVSGRVDGVGIGAVPLVGAALLAVFLTTLFPQSWSPPLGLTGPGISSGVESLRDRVGGGLAVHQLGSLCDSLPVTATEADGVVTITIGVNVSSGPVLAVIARAHNLANPLLDSFVVVVRNTKNTYRVDRDVVGLRTTVTSTAQLGGGVIHVGPVGSLVRPNPPVDLAPTC